MTPAALIQTPISMSDIEGPMNGASASAHRWRAMVRGRERHLPDPDADRLPVATFGNMARYLVAFPGRLRRIWFSIAADHLPRPFAQRPFRRRKRRQRPASRGERSAQPRARRRLPHRRARPPGLAYVRGLAFRQGVRRQPRQDGQRHLTLHPAENTQEHMAGAQRAGREYRWPAFYSTIVLAAAVGKPSSRGQITGPSPGRPLYDQRRESTATSRSNSKESSQREASSFPIATATTLTTRRPTTLASLLWGDPVTNAWVTLRCLRKYCLRPAGHAAWLAHTQRNPLQSPRASRLHRHGRHRRTQK